MPLQNRAQFEPENLPENLNPDEKVYYCDLTGEIFRYGGFFFDKKMRFLTKKKILTEFFFLNRFWGFQF